MVLCGYMVCELFSFRIWEVGSFVIGRFRVNKFVYFVFVDMNLVLLIEGLCDLGEVLSFLFLEIWEGMVCVLRVVVRI